MLKLCAQAHDESWLDLALGVRVRVRPATVAAIIVARNEASQVFRDEPSAEEPVVAAAATPQPASGQTNAEAAAALVSALARFAISAWEGVGNESDAPAPVTPENIDNLLTVWPVYRAFDEKYVSPALAGGEEKNGSSKPRGGTSTAGTSTAAAAA